MASASLVLLLAAVVATPAGAFTGPHRIIAGRPDQLRPSVNDAYLIWT